MKSMNTPAASAIPATAGIPRRYLRCHTHNPQNGKNGSIAELISAPTPHNAPHKAHPRQPGHCSNSSDTRKISASTKGVNVVSQIQCTDQYQTQGFSAQAPADQSATRGPKQRCAIK